MENSDKHFWITNLTKRSIGLDDLGIRIGPREHLNLLGTGKMGRGGLGLTLEQILVSEASGSLFQKKHLVVHRKFPPANIPIILHSEVKVENLIPRLSRSNVEIKEVTFEELDITDEQFALAASDLVDENFNK